jgi:hypothetical protein
VRCVGLNNPAGCIFPPPPVPKNYSVAGVTGLTFAGAPAPITGSATLIVPSCSMALCIEDAVSVHVPPSLKLSSTVATYRLFGFIPLQVAMSFNEVGPAAGGLTKEDTYTVASKLSVKVTSVSMFGLMLGGGPNCQTQVPSDVSLRSAPGGFSASSGGTMTGSYALSPLNNQCGVFGGLISSVVAGSGNTLNVGLVPKG